MEDDAEEVEQPKPQPAEPEDEVAAMRELNNKELEEVAEEDEAQGSEASDVGRPDMSPVRRELDMLQECRSVFLYEKIRKISEGTYGIVYKARDMKREEFVALKRVKMQKEAYKEGFPRTAIREMNILVQFHHPNIVNVSEVVVGKKTDEVYMVMEYMEHDLKHVMDSKMKQPFSVSETKQLMQQLLAGTAYLHENWILHRDLKTSNLLYNNRGQLKVCDFGLARQFAKDPDDDSDYKAPIYTHNVVTLWYRAPELLLGDKVYSSPIDVWSCGCIMAEFLNKKPLFDGAGELDQIKKIFEVLGAPTDKIWPGFSKLPVASKLNLSGFSQYNNLRSKFPKAAFSGGPCLSDSGFDLLNRMLTYDPQKRISCREALEHDWFRESPLPKDCTMMPTFPVPDDNSEKRRKSEAAQMVVAAMMKSTGSASNLAASAGSAGR
uniref:Cell division cycle 2-like n=1 Tax=Tetraselmis sp. GSL018 TaxID=582737 RepID=A0A061R3Y5_9CHLO